MSKREADTRVKDGNRTPQREIQTDVTGGGVSREMAGGETMERAGSSRGAEVSAEAGASTGRTIPGTPPNASQQEQSWPSQSVPEFWHGQSGWSVRQCEADLEPTPGSTATRTTAECPPVRADRAVVERSTETARESPPSPAPADLQHGAA